MSTAPSRAGEVRELIDRIICFPFIKESDWSAVRDLAKQLREALASLPPIGERDAIVDEARAMPCEPPQDVLDALYGLSGEETGSDAPARLIYHTVYTALSPKQTGE